MERGRGGNDKYNIVHELLKKVKINEKIKKSHNTTN